MTQDHLSKQVAKGKEARLNIVVPTAYRTKVKKAALKKGVTVRTLVRDAVDRYLKTA